MQYLILGGEVPDYRVSADQWTAFIDILHAHSEWVGVGDFVHHQRIQKNEVQRCFALLPLFLTVARATGKPLIKGNYLEMQPVLLGDRSDSAVTVVFQTLSTIYLPLEERLRVRAVVESAGAEGPLAWISTPTPEEHVETLGNYPLEVAIWPSMPKARVVARMSNSGDWLE